MYYKRVVKVSHSEYCNEPLDVKKNLRNKRTDLQTNNAQGLISKTLANLS